MLNSSWRDLARVLHTLFDYLTTIISINDNTISMLCFCRVVTREATVQQNSPVLSSSLVLGLLLLFRLHGDFVSKSHQSRYQSLTKFPSSRAHQVMRYVFIFAWCRQHFNYLSTNKLRRRNSGRFQVLPFDCVSSLHVDFFQIVQPVGSWKYFKNCRSDKNIDLVQIR